MFLTILLVFLAILLVFLNIIVLCAIVILLVCSNERVDKMLNHIEQSLRSHTKEVGVVLLVFFLIAVVTTVRYHNKPEKEQRGSMSYQM